MQLFIEDELPLSLRYERSQSAIKNHSVAFDRNHHRSKAQGSWPVTSVWASFAAVLGNISWKPVIVDADAVHWKQSMAYFDQWFQMVANFKVPPVLKKKKKKEEIDWY